jgi:hypothetical protein
MLRLSQEKKNYKKTIIDKLRSHDWAFHPAKNDERIDGEGFFETNNSTLEENIQRDKILGVLYKDKIA